MAEVIVNVKRKVDISKWILRAYLGKIDDYWDEEQFEFNGKQYGSIKEFAVDHPKLVGVQDSYHYGKKEDKLTIKLDIEIGTGKVKYWPKGVAADFTKVKLVDTGRYEIYDEKGNLIGGKSDYVPSCLGHGGYGDYLEFKVNAAGEVVPWYQFTQNDFDEITELED